MSGFLDKNDRIIDMVLTAEGRRLLSRGELDFTYFVLYDDEVDYDPYIWNSGSLTLNELSSSIEDQIDVTLVSEANYGMYYGADNMGRDLTNVNRPMFTMPQGQRYLSRIEVAPDIVSGTIRAKQRKIEEVHVKRDKKGAIVDQEGPFDAGYEKYDTSEVSLDVGVKHFFDQSRQKGFLIELFKSGSHGYVQVDEKRDLSNITSYGVELRLLTDEEIRLPKKRKR